MTAHTRTLLASITVVTGSMIVFGAPPVSVAAGSFGAAALILASDRIERLRSRSASRLRSRASSTVVDALEWSRRRRTARRPVEFGMSK